MDIEIADAALVLCCTGAQNLFGDSLGGAIVLNAVRSLLVPESPYGARQVPWCLAVDDPAINLDPPIDKRVAEGIFR